MPPPALVEVQNLVREVPGQRLLNHVQLAIRPGDRLAILGPTGSGKSLLLRAIALLDPAQEGSVTWQGNRIPRGDVPAFRSRVVYLHQRPVFTEGSVADNLRLPFSFRRHRGRRWNAAWTKAQLEILGRNESFLQQAAHDLSGGESQLVALLRALQLEPQVLLLDEPTAALDAATSATLQRIVHQWWAAAPNQRATVWVTHDEQQAPHVADRIFRMHQGELREVA